MNPFPFWDHHYSLPLRKEKKEEREKRREKEFRERKSLERERIPREESLSLKLPKIPS